MGLLRSMARLHGLHAELLPLGPPGPPRQVLRGMDLYVGAGGLGYMDNVSLLALGSPEVPPTPDPEG